MKTHDTREQIAELRAELASIVKSVEDLSRPDVLAISVKIDSLVVLYYRLEREAGLRGK